MSQVPTQTPMMPPQGPQTGGPPRFTPVDPLRLMRKYRLLLVAAAVFGVLAGGGLYVLLREYAPSYAATARIRVQPELTRPYEIGGPDLPREDEFLRLKRTQAAYIMSTENIEDAVNRVKDSAWFSQFPTIGDAMSALEEMLQVSLGDSELMEIKVTAGSPGIAKDLARAVRAAHVERMSRFAQQNRSEITRLYVDRRGDIEERIASVRNQMNEIMDRTQYNDTAANVEEIEMRFRELIAQRLELERELKTARRQLESLRRSLAQGQLEPTPSDLAEVNQSPVLAQLNQRILGLKEELRVRRQQFGDSHRTVKDLERRLEAVEIEHDAELQDRLQRLQDLKLSSAESTVSMIEASFQDTTQRLDEVRRERRELGTNMREYEQYQARLERLEDRLARMNELLTSMEIVRSHPSAVQVVSVGLVETPDAPVFPKAQTIIPGITFLMLAGVGGLLFLREMLDTRVKTPACAKLLPECETLGVIPEAQDDPDRVRSFDLVVAQNPTGLLAENFRQLRTEVVQRMQRHRFKTLMIVGCQPGGGVSAITANLAASIALNERRVLVVDANFRRPAQHETFSVDREPGLVDVLAGRTPVDQAIRTTEVQGLDVLPIGAADGRLIERLESNAFTQALRGCEQDYDLVLIDAPPLSIVGDSRVVANRVDAVLLTVRANREKRGMVCRLMAQLDDARGEFLGLVINGVRASAGGYYKRNFEAFYEYQNGAAGDRRQNRADRQRRRARATAGAADA